LSVDISDKVLSKKRIMNSKKVYITPRIKVKEAEIEPCMLGIGSGNIDPTDSDAKSGVFDDSSEPADPWEDYIPKSDTRLD